MTFYYIFSPISISRPKSLDSKKLGLDAKRLLVRKIFYKKRKLP